VAEEDVRTIECRSQLIIRLINELAQGGESLAVENLHRNDVDSGTEALIPGVEHRRGTAGVREAE